MIQLSVAICTYNRAQKLKVLLQSLCNTGHSQGLFEVLVIDNASADGTKEIVLEFSGSLNLVYAYEPKPGLSYARNRAIEIAKAEYIAYLDDDSRVPRNWVESVLHIVKHISPDIFGGIILPFYDSPKPRWFLDKYGTFDRGGPARYLQNGEYPFGSSMIVKKSLFKRTGLFDTSLGMKGTRMGYNDEGEFTRRAQELFPDLKIYYDPGLIVYHLVPRQKMSIFWYVKCFFYQAKFNRYFPWEKIRRKDSFFHLFFVLVFHGAVITVKLFAGVFRDRQKYRYYQNYFVESIIPHFSCLFEAYWGMLRCILVRAC